MIFKDCLDKMFVINTIMQHIHYRKSFQADSDDDNDDDDNDDDDNDDNDEDSYPELLADLMQKKELKFDDSNEK